MIARLFQQLINSVGVVWRTLRAFFARQFMGISARFRRITSFSRQAAKLVPKAMSSVALAGKKPTKREDFVETKRLFVSKSFIVLLLVGLVAFGLLVYFVIWPWLVSLFFTARLYQSESKVADYNGKVIVCYDETKKDPMLEGRMEKGLIQGQGKTYDEQGRVTYAGMFVDSLFQGKGSAYEEGVLVYEGDFAYGVYEGKGKLYQDGMLAYEGAFAEGLPNGTGTQYQDGATIYQGAFVDGVYEGQGTAFYTDGVPQYKGGFSQGLYEGEGTLYHPNGALKFRGGFTEGKYSGDGTLFYDDGQLQFKGSFTDGQYDGDGKLYLNDGTLLYEGGFLLGVYSGEGKLQLDPQQRLIATFENGQPVGAVEIYRSGKLYYAGEVTELVPNGMGTLYASTGEAIYTGNMLMGVPDLEALLGKTAEEVRTAFADATLIETKGEKNGFSINNAALGVTLFCTYKTEENEPTVYYVYGYDKGADAYADAMRWHSAAEYEAQAEGYVKKEELERAKFTGGVPYPNGKYRRTAYYYEGYVFVGWSLEADPTWLMVEWIVDQDLPEEGGDAAAAESGSAARLDDLLGKLGLADKEEGEGEEGAQSSSGSEAAAAQSAYYSAEAPTMFLSKDFADTPAQLEKALTYMADFYLHAETREAYETQAALKKKTLTAEQTKLAMGTGDQTIVDALTTEVARLELAASREAVAMEKTQLEAGDLVSGKFSDFDVSAALFVVDPKELDVTVMSVSGEEQPIQLALLDLELCWQSLQQAQSAFLSTGEAAAQVQQAFAMGGADEAALSTALCAQSEASIGLHQAIHACAIQMFELNTLSNGHLAGKYNWLEALG